MPLTPTPEQLTALLAGPAETPVVMLNLLRFRERAAEPAEGLSGREAYARHGENVRRFLEAVGGRVLWQSSRRDRNRTRPAAFGAQD